VQEEVLFRAERLGNREKKVEKEKEEEGGREF